MSCSPAPVHFARSLLMVGVAAIALSACASNRTSPTMATPDYSGLGRVEAQATLSELSDGYKRKPKDKTVILHYSAALRANGQSDQAIAVLENGMTLYGKDPQVRVAYAKALSTGGRFDQAMNVLDGAIDPAMPDWNALSVKGTILDQSGRNAEAREMYQQALVIAPNEPSLYANLGLSYAMTNELDSAEAHLRIAAKMPGSTSKVRQNLALVIGLQGRFDESRAIFAAELAPDEVEANMAYIRALLTQQNRWELIKDDGVQG